MKKILLLLFVTPIICFSQTSFSCNLKENCAWNEYTASWETCDDAYEDNCLFEMNNDETMFVHTTETIKSTYYVKKSRYTKEDQENGIFSYDVVSDAGNQYYFIFDITNKEVKAVSTSGEEEDWFLIRWYVKSIF
ncbi:MAG: hypothetical protein ACKVJW_06475 [Flavobacteriales bacterium]